VGSKGRSLSYVAHRAGEASVMLRITIQDKPRVTSFVIEGKLVGPWVKEFEKCWERVLAAEPSSTMLVNLTAVTFIDYEGRELLTRMQRQGVRLISAGLLTGSILTRSKPKWEWKRRNDHGPEDRQSC
jgi:hypothetical protein